MAGLRWETKNAGELSLYQTDLVGSEKGFEPEPPTQQHHIKTKETPSDECSEAKREPEHSLTYNEHITLQICSLHPFCSSFPIRMDLERDLICDKLLETLTAMLVS
jgi:hypothetical protein